MRVASKTRRSLLLGMGGLVAGCAQTPTLELAADAFKLAFSGSAPYPRTRAEIDALPYAQLGVRQHRSARGILVLAEKAGDELQWISSDRVLLATRGQRIVRTVGLEVDLASTRLLGPDLLDRYDLTAQSIEGLQLRRLIDLRPGDRYQIAVDSRFHAEGSETIDVLGERIDTLRVREEENAEQLSWRSRSLHWLSLRSSLAWKSVQTLAPDTKAIELEVLKRPA